MFTYRQKKNAGSGRGVSTAREGRGGAGRGGRGGAAQDDGAARRERMAAAAEARARALKQATADQSLYL